MREGWEVKHLRKVLKLEYGKPLPCEYRDDGGAYPAYGANGVKCRSKKFFFGKRSIIVGRKGSAGEVTLTGEKFWPLDVTYFVTFDHREYDLMFLYHCLKSLKLTRLANGVKPGINRNDVYSIEFAFPPLPEQKRIVAILDEAFAGIAFAAANAQKNLASARELFESYLNSVFSEKGKGWVICPLADCLQLITYGFTNPMPTTDTGPYMVTAKSVAGGRIDYASARHTSRDAFEKRLTDKSRPKIGDLLLTKDGTLGRVAVVDKPNICINQSVALLRPNGRMEPNFMRYLLSSSDYQRRMVGDADGTTIKHIYITRVDKMDIEFPASLSEQQRIVEQIDSFAEETQRLESLYRQKLAALVALRQSLLQKAFAGELTAKPAQALERALA